MSKRKPYEHFVLSNGLEVVLYPMPSVYTSFAVLYIRTGAIYEKQEERGLSHFTEHAALLGTKSYPTAIEFSKAAASIGASFNGVTTRRSTYYWVQMPYTEIDTGLTLLKEMVFDPILKEGDVIKERAVILTEYKDFMSVPEQVFGHTFWQKRFRDKEHPYTYQVLGLPENIEQFSWEDVLRWRREFYRPSNMLLSIAGRMDVGKTKEWIVRNFGREKKGRKSTEPRFKPGNYSNSTIYHYSEPREQITFDVSFPSFGWKEYPRRQEVVLSLLAKILGRGPDSRLFERLREQERFVYSVSCWTQTYPWRGELYIRGSTSHDNLLRALKASKEEINKILKEGIGKEELARGKKPLAARAMMGFDRPEAIAYSLADDIFNEEDVWLPSDYIKVVEGINSQEALDLAGQVFDFSKVNIGLFGDLSKEELDQVEQIFRP